mmetsp:Transcript_910/g.1454  ORF Transcript_910/g.1454 Transcript_910/m.1454 type:complete len:148 (+) Transcript_910:43-486(+)
MGGDNYFAHGCPERVGSAGLIGLGGGALFGIVQAAYEKTPKIEMRDGKPISSSMLRVQKHAGWACAATVVFAATECTVTNLMGKKSWESGTVAGLATGSVFGLASKSMKTGMLSGIGLGVIMFAFEMADNVFVPAKRLEDKMFPPQV